MSLIVPFIVIAIILMQIYFFFKNVYRMKEYSLVFNNQESWSIVHNPNTGFVSGIKGEGENAVFNSIQISINQYLSNNSGSIIDFHLLKDAIDRHCDAVENDINTLTPVPLYCGLAGTMAGVIIGLTSMLVTGSITALLTSGEAGYNAAANGVNDLLEGVAYAMLASICGIFLTTVSSILFKRYRLEAETGKNTFLAWLQAKLLPELPSDTSEALGNLVKNLFKFNNTFSENTSKLGDALKNVNESYRIQADIIKSVHDMDVMKMAQANVRVLRELNECTDKLERFNTYLNDIEGYTDAINIFTEKLQYEANKWSVLEAIRDFFTRHKSEIAKDTADADIALKTALRSLKDSTGESVSELHSVLVRQAEEFKNILEQQRDSFEETNNQIVSSFSTSLSQLPMLEEKISAVSEVPQKIDSMIERLEVSNNKLIEKLEISNSKLYSNIAFTLRDTIKKNVSLNEEDPTSNVISNPTLSNHMWLLKSCLILITIACITNTISNVWMSNSNMQIKSKPQIVEAQEQKDSVEEIVDSLAINRPSAPL